MLKISVIMPVYNAETYLSESILSVLNQTYNNFEFIIIDDGSTDNSIQIIESFTDVRIKLVRLKHAGIVVALNAGLKISQGEYVIRADADDISCLDRFARLLTYMEENKEIDICGSWATLIDENGKDVGEMKYPPVEHREIKKYTLLYCPFIHPSVIIRKITLDEVGGYRDVLAEDYELWTRILKKHIAHNISDFLIKYRIHGNQITKKISLKRKLSGMYMRVLALMRY